MKAVVLDLDQMLWARQAPRQNAPPSGDDLGAQLSSLHSAKLFDHNVILSLLVNMCRSCRRTVPVDEGQPAAVAPPRRHAVVGFSQDDIDRAAFERCRALHFKMDGLPASFKLSFSQLPASPGEYEVSEMFEW
jgi:hypothetical protein